MRKLSLLVAAIAALVIVPSAGAAIPTIFDGDMSCVVVTGGIRHCGGTAPRTTIKSFDGTPIDINVVLPPEPASGPDGNFPIVMEFHGYGGSKEGLNGLDKWATRGYAGFSMSTRGFGQSCGNQAARDADPTGCLKGYLHLIDTRTEPRDAQTFAEMLADQGVINPKKIGVTGASYGGGLSMTLAALRNRKMMADGSLVPWVSPDGKAMEIAVAVPIVPWTDIAYALAPNGSTLDYVEDAPYKGTFGVMKQSWVTGLLLGGTTSGYNAPVGLDPAADMFGWKAEMEAGEPYSANPAIPAMLNELTTYHSSYYIDHSIPPAPMAIASGFTDDLFPVNEAIRFYNRTKAQYPDAKMAMMFADAGHPRAKSSDEEDFAAGVELRYQWMAHFLKGDGPEPAMNVTGFTQTCPKYVSPGVLNTSGGPFTADNWADLQPGEVRYESATKYTIAADGGDEEIAKAFDPLLGQLLENDAPCNQVGSSNEAGTVNYRLPKVTRDFTMMGSPTVSAVFDDPSENSQVAARLWDVGPDGYQTLLARGIWRPAVNSAKSQVFQLYANGWEFKAGHTPKLQLLPKDAGDSAINSYARPSDGQTAVKVSRLQLRIPTLDRPGALGGAIKAPLAKTVPSGYKIAGDFADFGRARARMLGGAIHSHGRLRISCPVSFASCNKGVVKIVGAPRKGRRGRNVKIAKGTFKAIGGQSASVKVKLTAPARKLFRGKKGLKKLRVKISVSSAETVGASVRYLTLKG